METKQALLRQCDAVLSCAGVTGHVRLYWQDLRDKVQPSFASLFGFA